MGTVEMQWLMTPGICLLNVPLACRGAAAFVRGQATLNDVLSIQYNSPLTSRRSWC